MQPLGRSNAAERRRLRVGATFTLVVVGVKSKAPRGARGLVRDGDRLCTRTAYPVRRHVLRARNMPPAPPPPLARPKIPPTRRFGACCTPLCTSCATSNPWRARQEGARVPGSSLVGWGTVPLSDLRHRRRLLDPAVDSRVDKVLLSCTAYSPQNSDPRRSQQFVSGTRIRVATARPRVQPNAHTHSGVRREY